MSVSRRDFLGAGAAAAAGLALPKVASALPHITVTDRAELSPTPFAGRPDILSRGGDPLDAVVSGVQIVELDPRDQSVGLGGLPNEEGVVQLDASCMHGPTKRAGSVGSLEDVATAAAVARDVMNHTDHIMLVGAGARKFALEMGLKRVN